MDKEELINRIRQLEKNQPNFSLEDVQTEIKKRNEIFEPYFQARKI